MINPFDLSEDAVSLGGAGFLAERILDMSNRAILLIVRQSSGRQKKQNIGSPAWQAEQTKFLKHYGISSDRVETVDARGESAREGVARPIFENTLARIRNKEVGIAILSRGDRFSRNDPDSMAILRTAKNSGTLLMIGGRFYDPTEDSEFVLLQFMFILAELDNRNRNAQMVLGRFAKARNRQLRIALPGGLTYASEEDPQFVQQIRDAGMGEYLDDLEQRHRTDIRIADRAMKIFPYPDREVHASILLRLRWLRESRDQEAVIEQIKSDPDWPRPGCIPRVPTGVWSSNQEVEWIPLAGRADGTADQGRDYLLRWYKNPALFGVYRFDSGAVKQMPRVEKVFGSGVWAENAFPAFGTVEDLREVERILDNAPRPWNRGTYDGARNAAFPFLRCAERLPNGDVCGLAKRPAYMNQPQRLAYNNRRCHNRGHSTFIPFTIEDDIIDLVISGFTPKSIQALVDDVQVRRVNDRAQVRALKRDLSELHEQHGKELKAETDALARDDSEDVILFRSRRKDVEEQIKKKDADLNQVVHDTEQMRQLRQAELQGLLDLASDLPTLIQRIRHLPGPLAELMSLLTREVWVRREAYGAWEVEVVFPTGDRRSRMCFSSKVPSTQPLRLYAFQMAQQEADLDQIAKEIPHVFANRRHPSWQARAEGKWTGDRLYALALLFEHDPQASEGPPIAGELLGVRELSVLSGAPEPEIMRLILAGYLGTAQWDGELKVGPGPKELAHAFPAWAMRQVAAEQGWRLEDTLLAKDAAKIRGEAMKDLYLVAKRVRGIASDPFGRAYVHADVLSVKVETLEELLDRLSVERPELKTLDMGSWMRLKEACDRVGGKRARSRVTKHCPSVRADWGRSGPRTVYVWMDEALEQRIRGMLR